jgi:5-methyltetrahydropteroyltriglutamate--homocysteine methyltransferase
MDPEVNPIILAYGDGLMATHGGTTNAVRVTGPIGRGTFRAADLYRVAQSVSPKTVKYVSGMGPATIAAWLVDQHYQDRKALYRDLADADNEEFKDAVAAGARILQLDDVGFSLHAPEDYPLLLDTLNRALDGVDAFRVYHICHLTAGVPVGSTPYGLFAEMVAKDLEVDACEYALAGTGFPEDQLRWWKENPSDKGIGIGVVDIKRMVMETPEQIVVGVRKALEFVEPARIHLTTDCGMFSFPRAMARGSSPR